MIYLYSGATGSGKTNFAVRFIEKINRKGVDVYSNISLTFPKRKSRGQIYLFDNIEEILDVQDGLIFFDDAGVLFSSRGWEKLPIEFLFKLQLHRHHRLDLVATVPNIKSVDVAYRRLVHKWYYCHYLIKLGKSTSARAIFILSKQTPKNVDDIEKPEIYTDEQATNELNWRHSEKMGRFRIIWYYSKKLYDTHAKINFKRYKSIWIMDKGTKQLWTIPKEMSLKEGLRHFTLLKSQLRPKRQTNSYRR